MEHVDKLIPRYVYFTSWENFMWWWDQLPIAVCAVYVAIATALLFAGWALLRTLFTRDYQ